jgi:hypothetical protein
MHIYIENFCLLVLLLRRRGLEEEAEEEGEEEGEEKEVSIWGGGVAGWGVHEKV